MKTFTTYAEKKAKQFLNLLQGYTRGIRITAILILLLMGVSNAWAYTAHFSLMGNPTPNGWTKDTDFMINTGTGTADEWYIYAYVSNNQYFALNNGSNQYGPTTANKEIKNGSGGGTGNYNSNAWKFVGSSGIIKICCAESNNREWYPYVWVEESAPTIKFKHPWNGGSSWSEQTATKQNDGTYTYDGKYGNKKAFNAGPSGKYKYNESQTTVEGSPATGYMCRFIWNPVGYVQGGAETKASGTFKIVKLCSLTYDGNGKTGGTVPSATNNQLYNTSITLSSETLTKTGYTHTGWNTKADGSGDHYDKGASYTLTAVSTTLYAEWTEKTYSLTFKHDGHGTIKVGGTTVNSGGTASVNHVNTKTLVATANTGYNFSGWTLSGSNTSAVTIGNTSAASTTIKATNTGATVTANFTPKTYAITLNANYTGGTNGSATATYNSNTIAIASQPTRTDYRCNGYYTATSGGTLVLNIDGTLAKSVSDYTDADGNWIKDGTATLYAQWTYDVTEYTVTFGAGTGFTSYGSVTAYNNTTSATITSPATVRSGQNITFTATPNPGYKVEGWYTNAACTTDKHNAGNTTYTTTITAATNVYVKFVEKTWSVAFAAGNGGAVSPKETQTVGEANGVTIIATPNEGYTFNGWTSSNGGRFDDDRAEKTDFYPTAATTVTANFTENLYAITVKSSNKDHGTVSPESGSAGIDTKVTITATPVLGYKFVNWTATNGITIADANSTTTTITASAAGTVTANFELIPPTTIYIRSNGSYADFKWNYNSVAYDMEKVDCDGTYYTANVLGGIDEITITGSNNFTTTTLTVPTDGKTLYDLTSTKITHLYLKPNSNWTSSSAWFAAYFFGNGEKWVKMLDEDGDGIYSCEIPTDKTYPSVILVRMNSAKSALSWDSKWDQTNDLTVPTDGKNLYTVAAGAWSNGNGSWSTVWDNSRWATFEAPTLNVQVKITGKGSIVIDGETYTSITTGTETFAFTKASGENIAVGAITPEDRWELTSRQITMCDETIDLAASHTINGPATINLSFTQTKYKVVFNLGIPKGVPIPNWTVNNQYIDTGDTIVKPTVGEINGYLFAGWYTDGVYSASTLYNFGTTVTKDLELHARWVRYEECIFFKNNLNWDKIYVYTFTSDVWSEKGVTPKNNRNNFGQMTRIGLSDVYYYILTDLTGFAHIAFSDFDMSNYNEFYEHNAIYRADRQDKMQLFIPQRDQTAEKTNNTSYFSSGIWMKYNSTESGYKWSSDKNGWSTDINPFTAPITGGYTFTTKVYLSGGTTYQFKINNINNDWYSEPKTMTQDDCTDWWFKPESDPNKNAIIQPNVTGEYLFTLYLGDGKVMVSLEYPLGVGDYRLAYKDNTADSFHPGHYIRKRSTGTYRDTTSFFVFHDKAPVILLQECTAIDPATGTATWNTIKMYSCTGDNTTGDNPNNAMLPGKKNADGELSISGSSCGVDKTTVYNFVLLQEDNDANLATSETHLYTGEFYIRTDAAEGGWDYYRQTANKMNFSTYARDHEHFTHYFCRWINANKNVKFTIANDYSLCISDTLDGDELIRKNNIAEGTLPVDANVRFTWDNRYNTITRAYIAGSAWTRDRFLVLAGNEHLKDTDGNPFLEGKLESDRDGLLANEVMFKDLGNWIYQTDVNQNAQVFEHDFISKKSIAVAV